jgi:hypothetical protein
MIILQLSHSLALISSCTDQREAISEKHFQVQDSAFCSHKKPCKENYPNCTKHFQARQLSKKDCRGYIITYIGVRVGDVSRRLAREVKAGEVALLTLDLLILL